MTDPKKYHIGHFGSRSASGKCVHILKDMDLGNQRTMLLPICQGLVGRGSVRGNMPHAKTIDHATIDHITCKRCRKYLQQQPQLKHELTQ